jgi:hypothetical protein
MIISKELYRDQTFEIEMFPKAADLVVKKSSYRTSGNTSSEGLTCILNSEIKTEKIINPMLFGYDKDN